MAAKTAHVYSPAGGHPITPAKTDEDLAQQLGDLRSRPGEYLLHYGRARTAQTFIKHDLVDEYRLDVCPTTHGAGVALFVERNALRFVAAAPDEPGAMRPYERTNLGAVYYVISSQELA